MFEMGRQSKSGAQMKEVETLARSEGCPINYFHDYKINRCFRT